MKGIHLLRSVLLFIFSMSVLYAQAATDLCSLPQGKYKGKSPLVQDKAAEVVEQYVLKLEITKDNKVAGQISVFDMSIDDKGVAHTERRTDHFIKLKGCSPKDSVFQVSNPDVFGHIRILNINRTLAEITVSGAINLASEWPLGWVYDYLIEGEPEIDFRKIPIRLRKDLL